jgi:hypothetical protein
MKTKQEICQFIDNLERGDYGLFITSCIMHHNNDMLLVALDYMQNLDSLEIKRAFDKAALHKNHTACEILTAYFLKKQNENRKKAKSNT